MNAPEWSVRRRRAVLGACLAVWLAALVMTHIPARYVPEIRASDQVLHATGFFVLGGLFWLVLRGQGLRGPYRALVLLAVLAVYAGFDELTQPLLGRSAAWGDWNADLLGSTVALLVGELTARFGRRP